MNYYRITKYDPRNRNEDGHYLLDEWTCPSDVGDEFNGVTFSKEDYFKIESKYIDAIMNLLDSQSIKNLRVVSLEMNYWEQYLLDPDNKWLLEDSFQSIELFENKSLNIDEIKIVIKMILRNCIWCRLEIDGQLNVIFGWDYYMYVENSNLSNTVLKSIEENCLFVEELSPLSDNSSYKFSIQWGNKNEDTIEHEMSLNNINRDIIRKGLNYSIEHPCNHNFKITKENCSIFSDQFKFNFEDNDYYLDCEQE